MKKIFTNIIALASMMFLFSFLLPSSLAAQTAGDYRSITTGDWSATSTWNTYDGTTWVAATSAPGASNDVYIEESDEVTVDVASAVKNLNVDDDQSGTRLELSAVLEVSGILRSFKGTRVGAADTDNSGPNSTVIKSTGGGTLKLIGSTRDITTSGQWGGNPKNFNCEFALTSGQEATLRTTFKAGDITISSGKVICINDFRADKSGAGTADITVKDGAILRMTNNSAISRVGTASETSHIGTLTIESGAELEYNNTVGDIGAAAINFLGLVSYEGDAQTLVTKGSNSNGADPDTYTDLTLQQGAKTLGLNTTVNGILSMRTGGGAAPSLDLGGFSLIYGASSKLQYRGISAGVSQTTGSSEWPDAGSGNSMPPEVDIFNQNDVTLNADKAFTGELKLSGGSDINAKLILGANDLSVGSIFIPNPDVNKYIVTTGTGSLTLPSVGSSATLFPIGPSTSLYHPATITNAGTADDFSVRVESVAASCAAADESVNATWQISEATSGGSDCTLSLDFTGASVGGSFDSGVGELIDCGGSGPYAHNGSITGTVATGSNFTSFSPFGITSDGSALPVELISFTAKANDRVVNLNWQTASELNNNYFVVERSIDGRNFTDVTKVRGEGTSELINTYTAVDNNPFTGINYYRLRQVDYDGTEDFSDVVQIGFRDDSEKFKIYPTVIQDGGALRVDLTKAQKGNITFDVYDYNGKQVFSFDASGSTVNAILVDHLQNGMYVLQSRNAETVLSTRFVIAR